MQFIQRAAAPLAVIIIAITHVVTGFDPEAEVQTPLAQWGILVDMAVVPIVLGVVGLLLFRKLWSLSTERRLELREQLKELNL